MNRFARDRECVSSSLWTWFWRGKRVFLIFLKLFRPTHHPLQRPVQLVGFGTCSPQSSSPDAQVLLGLLVRSFLKSWIAPSLSKTQIRGARASPRHKQEICICEFLAFIILLVSKTRQLSYLDISTDTKGKSLKFLMVDCDRYPQASNTRIGLNCSSLGKELVKLRYSSVLNCRDFSRKPIFVKGTSCSTCWDLNIHWQREKVETEVILFGKRMEFKCLMWIPANCGLESAHGFAYDQHKHTSQLQVLYFGRPALKLLFSMDNQ